MVIERELNHLPGCRQHPAAIQILPSVEGISLCFLCFFVGNISKIRPAEFLEGDLHREFLFVKINLRPIYKRYKDHNSVK
jgi:hypothetical protein